MKFKELAEMSSDELQTKKRDMRQESLHLRLQQQSGQLTVLSQRLAKAETVKAEKK
jgi:ribosomal protein L29